MKLFHLHVYMTYVYMTHIIYVYMMCVYDRSICAYVCVSHMHAKVFQTSRPIYICAELYRVHIVSVSLVTRDS